MDDIPSPTAGSTWLSVARPSGDLSSLGQSNYRVVGIRGFRKSLQYLDAGMARLSSATRNFLLQACLTSPTESNGGGFDLEYEYRGALGSF